MFSLLTYFIYSFFTIAHICSHKAIVFGLTSFISGTFLVIYTIIQDLTNILLNRGILSGYGYIFVIIIYTIVFWFLLNSIDHLRIVFLIDITSFLRLDCFKNDYPNQKYIDDYKYFAEIRAYKMCELYKQTHCMICSSLLSLKYSSGVCISLLQCGHRFCTQCIEHYIQSNPKYPKYGNINIPADSFSNHGELLCHRYIKNEETNNNLFIPDCLIGTIKEFVNDYPWSNCPFCNSQYHCNIERFPYDPNKHDLLRSDMIEITQLYPYILTKKGKDKRWLKSIHIFR